MESHQPQNDQMNQKWDQIPNPNPSSAEDSRTGGSGPSASGPPPTLLTSGEKSRKNSKSKKDKKKSQSQSQSKSLLSDSQQQELSRYSIVTSNTPDWHTHLQNTHDILYQNIRYNQSLYKKSDTSDSNDKTNQGQLQEITKQQGSSENKNKNNVMDSSSSSPTHESKNFNTGNNSNADLKAKLNDNGVQFSKSPQHIPNHNGPNELVQDNNKSNSTSESDSEQSDKGVFNKQEQNYVHGPGQPFSKSDGTGQYQQRNHIGLGGLGLQDNTQQLSMSLSLADRQYSGISNLSEELDTKYKYSLNHNANITSDDNQSDSNLATCRHATGDEAVAKSDVFGDLNQLNIIKSLPNSNSSENRSGQQQVTQPEAQTQTQSQQQPQTQSQDVQGIVEHASASTQFDNNVQQDSKTNYSNTNSINSESDSKQVKDTTFTIKPLYVVNSRETYEKTYHGLPEIVQDEKKQPSQNRLSNSNTNVQSDSVSSVSESDKTNNQSTALGQNQNQYYQNKEMDGQTQWQTVTRPNQQIPQQQFLNSSPQQQFPSQLIQSQQYWQQCKYPPTPFQQRQQSNTSTSSPGHPVVRQLYSVQSLPIDYFPGYHPTTAVKQATENYTNQDTVTNIKTSDEIILTNKSNNKQCYATPVLETGSSNLDSTTPIDPLAPHSTIQDSQLPRRTPHGGRLLDISSGKMTIPSKEQEDGQNYNSNTGQLSRGPGSGQYQRQQYQQPVPQQIQKEQVWNLHSDSVSPRQKASKSQLCTVTESGPLTTPQLQQVQQHYQYHHQVQIQNQNQVQQNQIQNHPSNNFNDMTLTPTLGPVPVPNVIVGTPVGSSNIGGGVTNTQITTVTLQAGPSPPGPVPVIIQKSQPDQYWNLDQQTQSQTQWQQLQGPKASTVVQFVQQSDQQQHHQNPQNYHSNFIPYGSGTLLPQQQLQQVQYSHHSYHHDIHNYGSSTQLAVDQRQQLYQQ